MVQFASEHLKARKVGYINHDDAYGGWNLEAARARPSSWAAWTCRCSR